jgi:hypothetical protein
MGSNWSTERPSNKTIVIALCGVGIGVLTWMLYKNKVDNFETDASIEMPPLNYKPGFLPAYQGPHFQGMPPSLKVENDYHAIMLSDCNGDYGDFRCRQKAYIKAMKAGTTDKADLICWRHRDNEDDFYDCMDGVYGNYVWADRYTGPDGGCVCPNSKPGTVGTLTADDMGNKFCFCPEYRPLHDRQPVDRNDDIVDRVVY